MVSQLSIGQSPVIVIILNHDPQLNDVNEQVWSRYYKKSGSAKTSGKVILNDGGITFY